MLREYSSSSSSLRRCYCRADRKDAESLFYDCKSFYIEERNQNGGKEGRKDGTELALLTNGKALINGGKSIVRHTGTNARRSYIGNGFGKCHVGGAHKPSLFACEPRGRNLLDQGHLNTNHYNPVAQILFPMSSATTTATKKNLLNQRKKKTKATGFWSQKRNATE